MPKLPKFDMPDIKAPDFDKLQGVWNTRQRAKRRKADKEYLNQTRDARNIKGRPGDNRIKTKKKVGPDPEWYKPVAIGGPIAAAIALGIMLQYLAMTMNNLAKADAEKTGFFHGYGVFGWYIPLSILILAIAIPVVWKKTKAQWYIKNAIYLDDDIEDYHNDAYVRTVDHLTTQLDVAPDVGLGFDGHASSLISHIMVSNKGIKKIKVPVYDPTVDGFVKRDAEGNIVYETKPMFDEELAHKLFDMSGVPQEFRTFYDARDYDFNPKTSNKKDAPRIGTYDRKPYDTLADAINNDFFVLDTETARPAGVYFYDKRSVNTILIAITRGGKGQTYIEPAFDVWTREKNKWNIFTTDPKGGVPRSIVKSYSLAA